LESGICEAKEYLFMEIRQNVLEHEGRWIPLMWNLQFEICESTTTLKISLSFRRYDDDVHHFGVTQSFLDIGKF
jgi:hypothetical protein